MIAFAIGVALLVSSRCANASAADRTAIEFSHLDWKIEDPSSLPGKSNLSRNDRRFLDQLESRGIRFFIDNADPVTGLMPDRAKADGSHPGDIASIASVGFGLTALCVGDERSWISHQEAYDRCRRVLAFLRDHVDQYHGYYCHWLKMSTGERAWNSEVSDIDTALLMAGVLVVRQHFPDTPLARLADGLYQRVDWPWMLTSNGTLAMGYSIDRREFLPATWHDFNEGPLIYLMGLGSKSHPLPPRSWQAWHREPVMSYAGLTFIQCPPLFTHQYPQVWFDLRGLRDDYADYFRNSQLATIAQRQWTIDDLAKRFSDYGPNAWGLTASDCEGGYTAWGGPSPWKDGDDKKIDGTIVSAAPAGSLAFEPRLCLDDLENLRAKYGKTAFGKYGFVDAFNPLTGWYDTDVLGIDIGPSILMAENCQSGFVWKTFMSAPEARAALSAASFRGQESPEDHPTTSLVAPSATAGTGG